MSARTAHLAATRPHAAVLAIPPYRPVTVTPEPPIGFPVRFGWNPISGMALGVLDGENPYTAPYYRPR